MANAVGVNCDQRGLTDSIMAWEDGILSDQEEIVLFQRLVDTGMAWSLQGAYGRRAQQLIDAGMVTQYGPHS